MLWTHPSALSDLGVRPWTALTGITQFHSNLFDRCSKKTPGQSKQVQQVGQMRGEDTKCVPIWNIRQTVRRRHHNAPRCPPQSLVFVPLLFLLRSTTTVHKHRSPSPGPARSAHRKVALPRKAVLKTVDMISGLRWVVPWRLSEGCSLEGPSTLILKTSDWVEGAETAGCVALWKECGGGQTRVSRKKIASLKA